MEKTMRFCQSCGMPITKEEYIARMKMYFPQLKRWRRDEAEQPFV